MFGLVAASGCAWQRWCLTPMRLSCAAPLQLSFCSFVYPCLVVTYMGQASYLVAHPEAYVDPFWMSVPHGAFWPMLIVATCASVVASQALISGVFSIMRQVRHRGLGVERYQGLFVWRGLSCERDGMNNSKGKVAQHDCSAFHAGVQHPVLSSLMGRSAAALWC